MTEMVILGKIVGAYGVKGWVRIHPFADDPAAWAKLTEWQLQQPAQNAQTPWQAIKVLQSKVHGNDLTACLDGITDRGKAEDLRGFLVGVPRAAMPITASNEYYWGDLIGLEVINQENIVLGRISDLIETGANDVLQICNTQGTERIERLLPFVAAIVLDVDLAAGVVRVDWNADW